MEGSKQYKKWTASRKAEVVIRMLRGESLDTLSRELGVEVYVLEGWRTHALEGMELGLKSRQSDPLKAELDQAKRRIGELIMENELLTIKASRAPSFHTGRSGK